MCPLQARRRGGVSDGAGVGGVMMLAMALAHRQRAARAGGGWCREGSAQPPGLCTLLAAIALFLVLVGSATLGVERAVAAVENTRSDKLPAYNSAAMSWRLGGSAAFANESRGLELRVNGAPTPLVPRNGTSSEDAVPAAIADTRDDVARVRSTHVLYASIPRANTRDGASHGSINGSILVPPGVLVTFSVGRRKRGTKVAVGPAGDDGRGVAFAPFSCAAWSHSRVSARDRVDCDACATQARRASVDASARCAAACDAPGTGRRFVARRAWVVAAELVVEEDADDRGDADDHGDASFSSSFSVPLRRPTNAGCALRYHADVLSRAEWDTAAAVRAFCASTEGRGAPRLAPNRNDEIDENENENENESLPLAVTVRSSRDPRVVAGALTRCSYDFGPSAREHASSAAFLLLLSFACVAAAAYWSRGRAACFPARLLEEGTDDGGGDGERRAGPAYRYAAATRAVPEAERDARIGGGREPLEARRPPPRAYVLEPSGRDRRRRERDSAARVVEMAETRGGSGARGGGRGAFAV